MNVCMSRLLNIKTGVEVKSNYERILPTYIACRAAHTQHLTRSIQYISNDKIRLEVNRQTMKLNQKLERPLCLLIKWLMANPKHVMKYANIYLKQGFDVITVGCTPWQLMWPVKGSQLVAADLLRFMKVNEGYGPVVLHGFSVGGYLWGELCVQALADKDLYQPVLDRVVAQVWDSVVDFTEVPVAVPMSLFPSNMTMQKALQIYIKYHLKALYASSTVHYERSSRTFQYNPCAARALLLVSNSDTLSPETTRRKMFDTWTSIGIHCSLKIFEGSPHVQHLNKYPREYLTALHDHLNATNLVSRPEKVKYNLNKAISDSE